MNEINKIIWLLLLIQKINSELDNTYWIKRLILQQNERNRTFGGNLMMNHEESKVNNILMHYKKQEIYEAFTNSRNFLPSRNFMQVRDKIEQSIVYKIIQAMPKGAVLHSHGTSAVSSEWIFNNVTYREHLYACDKNGFLALKFFEKPSNDCNWQLLSELRSHEDQADAINTKIRNQLSMMTTNPDETYPTNNDAWNKFEQFFKFIGPLLTYRPVHRDHFYQGLEELYEDNVLYLELRSTIPKLYDLNGTEYGPLETMKIYYQTTERFREEHEDFVGVKIIYSPHKNGLTEDVFKKINLTSSLMKKYPDFFAGLDLVGHEDRLVPIKKYIPGLSHLINKVKFYFHAGETNWYGLASDENLLDAILLNTTRIGHGYAVVKHPEVLEIVKQRNIPIEVCPISNQVLGLVKDLRNHPANILFASNFPVVVSNDDPGLWGSKALSYDFYEAFMGMMSREADIRALKQLAINSIDYSSMNDYQKVVAKDIWSQKWNKFIQDFYNSDIYFHFLQAVQKKRIADP
ncbi:adenosine deaminase 2-like [Chelonus insularis]|uniref:adenosine deaminase 2-like n=1 Tax=Chelonus insularis TaxID=460826 RepID=UPI00158CBEC9|nr:adenosine deaminase 2-like [Chelonus insularis]